MIDMTYLTVAKPAEHEEIVKGSRFLGFAFTVESAEEAAAKLEGVRERDADATHHAWAYVLGPEYRFSDDGEPGGTAGPCFKSCSAATWTGFWEWWRATLAGRSWAPEPGSGKVFLKA